MAGDGGVVMDGGKNARLVIQNYIVVSFLSFLVSVEAIF